VFTFNPEVALSHRLFSSPKSSLKLDFFLFIIMNRVDCLGTHRSFVVVVHVQQQTISLYVSDLLSVFVCGGGPDNVNNNNSKLTKICAPRIMRRHRRRRAKAAWSLISGRITA
jgi:hypothetical protein